MLDAINRRMIKGLISRGIPKTFLELVERLHEILTDSDSLKARYRTYRTTRKTNVIVKHEYDDKID